MNVISRVREQLAEEETDILGTRIIENLTAALTETQLISSCAVNPKDERIAKTFSYCLVSRDIMVT